MEGRTTDDGVVRVGANARERYYDSQGYGTPAGDALDLLPVEAAHLLYRGDLDTVDGMDFRTYLGTVEGLAVRFLVYANLRGRGFYLAPVDNVDDTPSADFAVFPRGKGPWDDEVEYRVRTVGERDPVDASDLGDLVLAVVDEESEITYLASDRPEVAGSSRHDLPSGVPATLLDDRVVVWDAPAVLYERGFFGQPFGSGGGGGGGSGDAGAGGGGDGSADADTIQLSLVEAAHLVDTGVITVEEADRGHAARTGIDVEDGRAAVLDRGRAVEGERFDHRLRVYDALRDRGVVPKTGFKFGADFRTYADVESVEELGHSELLVRVLPSDHVFSPRDLALDVRLAHGVRKRMVFALVADGGESEIEWLAVERITP